MTVSEKEASIIARLKELVAYRGENGKCLTRQAMADLLNTEGVSSLSGKPWSTYSISRILKKFALRPSTGIIPSTQAVPKASPPSDQPEETVEHRLKHTSPLMQWNYYESIRDVVEKLTKKHHSVESLVGKLNKMGVSTADGSPWNEIAVSRALKVLQPISAVQVGVGDDVIRERIKEGWYDTKEESFVCVGKKLKKRGKDKAKRKSPEGIGQKKKKRRKTNEKKKKKK